MLGNVPTCILKKFSKEIMYIFSYTDTIFSFSPSLYLELTKNHNLHSFCWDFCGTLGRLLVVFSCSEAFEIEKCSLIWMKEAHPDYLHVAGAYAENTRGTSVSKMICCIISSETL